MAHISCESIGIDDIQISYREVFTEVENIVQKYSLDMTCSCVPMLQFDEPMFIFMVAV